MKIKMTPISITNRQIELFRNIVVAMVRSDVSDTMLGILLVCVGSMAGWPQLSRLEELEEEIKQTEKETEEHSRLKQVFLSTATLIEDKARVAWFNETGELLRL